MKSTPPPLYQRLIKPEKNRKEMVEGRASFKKRGFPTTPPPDPPKTSIFRVFSTFFDFFWIFSRNFEKFRVFRRFFDLKNREFGQIWNLGISRFQEIQDELWAFS